MKRFILAIAALALALTACSSEADVASRNLSQAAEDFEVERRIVFFNGITDTYLLSIEGRCSIEADTMDGQLEVTCKVDDGGTPADDADDEYKKHFLGLSDNVSYFVEQLEPIDVNVYRYQVFFRPSVIVPDVQTDLGS